VTSKVPQLAQIKIPNNPENQECYHKTNTIPHHFESSPEEDNKIFCHMHFKVIRTTTCKAAVLKKNYLFFNTAK